MILRYRRMAVIAIVGLISGGLTFSTLQPQNNAENPVPLQDERETLYAEYDREFQAYLDQVIPLVGKETFRLEKLSDRYTVPKKLQIQGTPYELGFTVGLIARRFGLSIPLKEHNGSDLHRQIVEMYRKIYPQYLQMIWGVADAYDVAVDRLDMVRMEYRFFLDLWLPLFRYQRFYQLTAYSSNAEGEPNDNCSLVAYQTDRQHIVGRNWDNSSDRPHFLMTSQLTGCYKTMGHAVYDLYFWVADGINEKGLSISQASNGEEYFWQDPYPAEPAVFSSKMARMVMDTCASVEEAIRLIGSVQIWFPNQGLHWLLADSTGKSVIVEFDLNRKMVVFDKSGPYELATNTALQKGEDYLMNHCWRYRTAKTMLDSGVGDLTDMFQIMSAIRQSSGGVHTLWTTIMDLNRRSLEVRYRKEYDRRYEYALPQDKPNSRRRKS